MKRTALITGASGGIGRELARLFAADRHDVALVARRRDKLAELSEELEERYKVTAHIVPEDLSRPGAAAEVAARLADQDVAVDALVNNAGFAQFGYFAKGDPQEQLAMLTVNVIALTELTRRFLPGMVDRRAGRILNVGSTASFVPGPLMAAYYATKAYVLSFSLALSEEVRGTGVTVTALCPGPTESGFQVRAEMTDSRLVAGRKLASSQEVAEFGYRELMAGKSLAVEGTKNRALVLGSRLMPRTLAARITLRAQERLPGG